MRGQTICILVASLGLAGCSSNQAGDVASYRQLSDAPQPLPMPRAGEPLSLVDALRLTTAYNEQLAVQGERSIQTLAQRQRAGAALLPSFDFFTGVALRENGGSNRVVQTDVGINGQYRLLTGLSDLRNVEAADFRVESSRWLILDLRESLLVQTARAYYATLRAERLSDVLASSVDAQTERLNDARARNEVGFARPLDVSQIESQVSRTRAQLIAAQREAAEARSTLAFLVNAEIGSSSLVDGFEALHDKRSIDLLVSLARANRQDVRAARSEADASRAEVDAAIGQYAPSIGVNLDYFLIGAPDDPVSDIASLIEIRLPLFSAGRIEADVRESWSRFRERVLTYRSRTREVRRDVETAYIRLQESLRLEAELRTQVRVARQALELAEASYEAGVGTNLERVTAQDELLTAELQAVSQSFLTKTASLELRRACGLLSAEMLGTALPAPETRPPPTSPFLDRSTNDERSPSATTSEPVVAQRGEHP